VLAPDLYPPSAQRVLSDYRRDFVGEAGPYALYGYEAMSVVLDAIRDGGARGNDRQVVTERVFATRNRNSVLGRYSIEPDGETTLSRYGVDRVLGGRPVFYRAIDVQQTSPSATG
jgi:branched-chain amino acid transport system substrate-binding protein